jgi:hypothetical protein
MRVCEDSRRDGGATFRRWKLQTNQSQIAKSTAAPNFALSQLAKKSYSDLAQRFSDDN